MPWPLDPPPASEREIGQDDGLGGSNVTPYVPSPTSRMHERAMQTVCETRARARRVARRGSISLWGDPELRI